MSIKIMSWVWEFGPKQPTERLVLLALADNANDEGCCWPSLDTIAKKTCLSVRSVIRSIKKMKEAGLLKVEKRHENSNRYTIVTQSHNHSDRESQRVVTQSHIGSDTESLKPSVNHQLLNTNQKTDLYTEAHHFILDTYGAKRFKNKVQIEIVQKLYDVHGMEKFREAVLWTAKNGMTLSRAIAAIETALPKWGKSKKVVEQEPQMIRNEDGSFYA